MLTPEERKRRREEYVAEQRARGNLMRIEQYPIVRSPRPELPITRKEILSAADADNERFHMYSDLADDVHAKWPYLTNNGGALQRVQRRQQRYHNRENARRLVEKVQKLQTRGDPAAVAEHLALVNKNHKLESTDERRQILKATLLDRGRVVKRGRLREIDQSANYRAENVGDDPPHNRDYFAKKNESIKQREALLAHAMGKGTKRKR